MPVGRLELGFLVLTILVVCASPSQSQSPSVAPTIALHDQITAEIQDELASPTRGRFVNGGSLEPKIPAGSQQPSAASGATLGFNRLSPTYCYMDLTSAPVEVVVFTTGAYVYSTNPSLFPILASACPAAITIAINVTAISGTNFSWSTFYVLHN
jgi:hypothetical protein